MTFVASNGVEISDRGGRLWADSVWFPISAVTALMEYERYLDDQRRGWWRSKLNPEVAVLERDGDRFRVLDTSEADPLLGWVSTLSYKGVIEEYLADQKPTPQDGEVWLVSVEGGEPEPALVLSSGNIETTLNYFRLPDPDVELIRRIYPTEDET